MKTAPTSSLSTLRRTSYPYSVNIFRFINIFFTLLVAIAFIGSTGYASASTLVAGFATTNARPNFGVYKPSETIPITFGATGAASETLAVTTYDIEGNIVAGPTNYSVTSANWSTTINAYNAKLGFYRIYAKLSDNTLISNTYVSGATTPQLFASAVPSGNVYSGGPLWSAYAGPVPGNFISYAIVPDPTTRIASIPETQAFFGMQASISPTVSSDAYAFLGIRWVLDGGWCWNQMQPNQNQETTFISNPAALFTWATNGNGSTAWTLYSIPNLTKDGAPFTGAGGVPFSSYPGTPNVYKSGTFIYNTGALSSSYYTDWDNFATHVAQQWPAVYPSRTEHIYEITWEPIIPWGYGSYSPSESDAQLETDLATMYSQAKTYLHGSDSKAYVMGPTCDVDSPNGLGLNYAYLDAGLKNSIDIFSSHPYMENDADWIAGGEYDPEMAGQPANIDTMKRHLNLNYGLTIPMIGTEQGWRTHQSIGTAPSQTTPTPSAFNEINQARRMVRGNLIMLGECWQMNTAFTFNDYPSDDNYDSNHYWDWGLFYNLDPVSYGGYGPSKVMPKPIAASYAAMTYLTEGRHSVNKINWLGDTIRGYDYESYTNTSDELIALWDFSGSTTNVTINTGVASVTEYDWMGNATTVSTTGGNLTVTLKNSEPVYIKGVAASLWGCARTPVNVAYKKTVTTSGDSSSTTPGSLAVDGDVWSYESQWVSTNDANAKWLTVNLGASYSISEIRFYTGSYNTSSGYGSGFNFYRNPLPSYHLQQWNGSAWVDIVNRTSNTKAAVDEVFTPVTTTQVRLLVDAQSSAWQAMVYEIQVLGTPTSGAPVITTQPNPGTYNVGDQIAIIVNASGTGLSYQWYKNGVALSGQTLYLVYIYPAATSNAGLYYCKVSNANGSVNSDTVQITVGGATGTGPVITVQPGSTETVNNGTGQVSMQLTATGTGTLSYQWYHNGVAMAGQTSYLYYKYPAAGSDAGTYYCVVTDSTGSTTSNTVTLTVLGAGPTITSQPNGGAYSVGGQIYMAVSATGSGTLTYQWYQNGVAMSGQTLYLIYLYPASSANAGNYYVVVTDSNGSTTSSTATVTVQ